MSEATPQTEVKAAPPAQEPAAKPEAKDAKAKPDSGVASAAEHPGSVKAGQESAGSSPAPAPAEKVAEEREARRIALLKKEAERVAKEKSEFEAQQKRRESEFTEVRQKASNWDEFTTLVKTNPLEALSKAGLDYDALIRSELERQELESNPAIKEVRELKARLAAEEKQRKEAELQTVRSQHQGQIDAAVREIQTVIDSNPDKYEFLKTAHAAKDVFQRIYDVFSQTTKRDAQGRVVQVGRTLTTQEACDLLEAEYDESWKSIAGLKKVASYFQSKSEAAPDKNKNNDTKNKGERDAKSPVLSNSNTSGPVQATRLSKKEKTARAFEAMRAAAGH